MKTEMRSEEGSAIILDSSKLSGSLIWMTREVSSLGIVTK
jgi:hypothetical protein